MFSLLGINGLLSMRAMDWLTFSSRSEKDSRAKCGLMPTSSCICCFTSSSEKVSIPQSVCCISMISSVPTRRWEMTRERISSSVITPPALRMMCASPSCSPSMTNGLKRASMHVTTATRFAGGIGRSPLSKVLAYSSLFLNNSSIVLICLSSHVRFRLQVSSPYFSCHVRFEGVGQLVDGGERGGVLLFHVLDKLCFRVEEHFGVVLLLLLQGRVFEAAIVVARIDEQVAGEGAVRVIEGVVLADGVAVGEVGAPARPYEQGVGGQDAIRQQHGDQVLGVARGMDELEREFAQVQPVTVLHPEVDAARRC